MFSYVIVKGASNADAAGNRGWRARCSCAWNGLLGHSQLEVGGWFYICAPVSILLLDFNGVTSNFRENESKCEPSRESCEPAGSDESAGGGCGDLRGHGAEFGKQKSVPIAWILELMALVVWATNEVFSPIENEVGAQVEHSLLDGI